MLAMTPVTARVSHGHLLLDVATSLPDGTEMDLVADDAGDTLSSTERALLHAELVASLQEARAGRVMTAEAFLASLPPEE